MPTTAFTDDEIESVREIVGMGTSTIEITELTGKLSAFNDAQATAARKDITKWTAIEYGTTRVKGGIKGTDFNIERDRLLITNRMRGRLNYPLIASATSPDDIALTSISVPGWIGSGMGDEFSSDW